jgi:hypothetical protein
LRPNAPHLHDNTHSIITDAYLLQENFEAVKALADIGIAREVLKFAYTVMWTARAIENIDCSWLMVALSPSFCGYSECFVAVVDSVISSLRYHRTPRKLICQSAT